MSIDSPPPVRPQSARLRTLGRTVLAGILLAALTLLLEVWGLHWGLPSLRNYESFHPDEWTVISAAERVNPLAGQINPGFYNYGSVYIYCLRAAFAVGQALGLYDLSSGFAADPQGKASLYLTARCVTVLFSVGTVLLTWRLGRRMFGNACGLIAGGLLAVSPLFAIYSHYAIVDVPATFWIVVAVLTSAHTLRRTAPASGTARLPAALVLGAVAAGLAAGTKYNAGVALLAPLWCWWRLSRAGSLPAAGPAPAIEPARAHSRRRFHRTADAAYRGLLLVAAAFLAFLISTPGVLTDRQKFLEDFSFEVVHVRTGHDFIFTDTAPGFLHHITQSLRAGLGPPLLALSLLGVLLALLRRRQPDALLAVVALPYYLLIGAAQVKFMRYTIPLLPFLCLWAARLLAAGLRQAPERLKGAAGSRGLPEAAAQAITALCLLLAAGFALVKTAAFDGVLAGPDVRLRAQDWIEANARAGASIGMIRPPWFDTPPVVPYNSIVFPQSWFTEHAADWPYRLSFTGYSAAALRRARPQFFVVTEWELLYRLRLHRLEPRGSSAAARAGQEAADLVQVLNTEYRLAATFDAPASLGPLTFHPAPAPPGEPGSPDHPALGSYWIPDDWLLPNPTIWIYERR